MNTDYRINTAFYNDLRTAKLSYRLGDSGLAALNFLWCWSAMYCASGVLHDMTEEDIEIVAKWHGEPGKLVPVLLELHWLDKSVDGTYALHDWAETNPWAADAENRSDKARLSGMAKNYPELHKTLVAQGATGITKEEYARLTAEYNSKGIAGKDKEIKTEICDLRFASDAPAPTPQPAPEPKPKPIPEPFSEDTKVSSSSASTKAKTSNNTNNKAQKTPSSQQLTMGLDIDDSEKNIDKGKTIDKAKTFDNTGKSANSATQTANLGNANAYFIATSPATIEAVIALWNDKLTSAGFPHIHKLTPARGKMFVARLKADEDRKMLSWWIQLFDRMLASDFMLKALADDAKWLTIDWVLTENNLVKIFEGRYDNKTNKSTETTQTAEATSNSYEEDLRQIEKYRRILFGDKTSNPDSSATSSDLNVEYKEVIW